jgi:acetyl-CoA C-acetyltransferase
MKEVVIVGAVRTPTGTHGGALRDLTAQELGRIVMQEVLSRTQLDPKEIDEVIFGCGGQASDAPNIARVAALMAGLPASLPGYTVQRNCASGLQAITSAAQAIKAGDGDCYLVGGMESMSNFPYVVRGARWGLKLRHSTLIDSLWEGLTDPVCNQIMGLTAENLAEQYQITRQAQDEYAVQSHKKAFMAQRTGKFNDEMVKVMVPKKVAGQEVAPETFAQDEGINPAISVQKLALYPTIFKKVDGTVTPGNSCPLNDGATALIVMSADKAKALGYQPMATIRSYAYAAVPPEIMGIGPAYAIPKVLEKAGVAMTDVDLVEINEAFAAQVLAVGQQMEQSGHNWDWNKVNVNGGAIALGHPIGASAAKITTTLLFEMARRGATFGIATMCVGGGQGGAMLIERK